MEYYEQQPQYQHQQCYQQHPQYSNKTTTTTTTTNDNNNMKKRKAGLSLKRRRQRSSSSSIVRRSFAFVHKDVSSVVSESSFLKNTQPREGVAVFHRSEILTGEQPIGHGGFSHVYEITGFRLRNDVDRTLSFEQQQARRHLAATCYTSYGQPRLAIKHLQQKMAYDKDNFGYATSDLSLEAAFLTRFHHENIMSVRGLPVGGLSALHEGKHDGFFLILDKVEETLDQRIQRWKQQEEQERYDQSYCSSRNSEYGCFPGSSGNHHHGLRHQQSEYERKQLLVQEKMDLALQLADALEYLHSRRIVFRDIKPHNIGIIGNQLKLFDFGLSRELPQESPTTTVPTDPVFHMSGVGTRRYMAVEIINSSMYNAKADVYSWSMVAWEMFSLSRPYPTYSVEDHRVHVCQQGERPNLNIRGFDCAPESFKNLLRACWTEDISSRLTIKEASCMLDSIIQSSLHLSSLSSSQPSSVAGRGSSSYYDEENPLAESFSGIVTLEDEDELYNNYCNYDGDHRYNDSKSIEFYEGRENGAVFPKCDQNNHYYQWTNNCHPRSPTATEALTCLTTVSTESMTESEMSAASLSCIRVASVASANDDDSFRQLLVNQHRNSRRNHLQHQSQAPAAAASFDDLSIMTISMSSHTGSSFLPPGIPIQDCADGRRRHKHKRARTL